MPFTKTQPDIDVNAPRQLRASRTDTQLPSGSTQTVGARKKATESQVNPQATPQTPEANTDKTGQQRMTRSGRMLAPLPIRTSTRASNASKKSANPAGQAVDPSPKVVHNITRPKPRHIVGPVSHDSDDNFNIRRVRERARAKSVASSQDSTPPQLPEGHDLPIDHSRIPNVQTPSGIDATEVTKGANAERRSPSVPTSVSDEEELVIPGNVLVPDFAFYRCSSPKRTTMSHYSGRAPFAGDPGPVDRLTEVRDEKTGKWVPLPTGHCAPRRLDTDEDEAAAAEEAMDKEEESEGSDVEQDSAFYRYNFPGAGVSYYSGIPPFLGDPGAADRLTEVRNEETCKWGPLPAGYCAPRRSDGDQQEAEEAEEQGRTSAVQQGSDLEYESTPTGSDYSDNRKVQEKDRARRRTRGKSVSDTEEEDAEDDRDLADDTIPEKQTGCRQHNKRAHTPRFTKAQKGKGREKGGVRHMTDGDTNQEPIGPRKIARGHSKEEVEEIDTFGQRVAAEADALARKWNRQHRDVMLQAGLGMRLSRKGNTYNEYRAWYASVHQKGPEITRDAWNEMMTRDYNKLMDGLNAEERKAEMQQIQDDHGMSAVATDVREAVTRVKAYIKQLEGLATSIDRTDGDVQIVGLVTYTGIDQAARQASGVFAGSPNARLLVDQNKFRVQHLVDVVTTKFRSLIIEQELATELPAPEESGNPNDRRPGEKEREWYRRVVSTFLLRLYNKFSSRQMQSFPWKLWIAAAYRLQLRLENWAIGVLPAPGADFKVEDLRVQEWKVLAVPIISGVGKQLNIVPWNSEELALDKADAAYARVPLVTNTSGMVLQRVEACSDFQKELAKAAAKELKVVHGKRRGVDEREIRPLPSRKLSSMAANAPSANPRPHKRPRRDDWEMGEDMYAAGGADIRDGLLSTEGLYRISPDESDVEDAGYGGGADHNDNFTGGTRNQHAMVNVSHASETYVPQRSDHRAVPSFHAIAQGGRPPPSARSLKPGPTYFHPSRPLPPVSSQQAVAGPSRISNRTTENRPRYGYYRSGRSKVDLAMLQEEEQDMEWE